MPYSTMNDDSEDEVIAQHLGYYVRRENDTLVLVETLLMEGDNPDTTDIYTVHIPLEDLEPEWVEALYEQGSHLEEGKSCEFVAPDDPDEDDFDEDED